MTLSRVALGKYIKINNCVYYSIWSVCIHVFKVNHGAYASCHGGWPMTDTWKPLETAGIGPGTQATLWWIAVKQALPVAAKQFHTVSYICNITSKFQIIQSSKCHRNGWMADGWNINGNVQNGDALLEALQFASTCCQVHGADCFGWLSAASNNCVRRPLQHT